MRIAAFDAKNFDRTKPVEVSDPLTPGKVIKKQKGFFTPLGVGVLLKDGEAFSRAYCDVNGRLATDFGMAHTAPFYSSNHLKKKMGMAKSIAYCNALIEEIQRHIELVHVSFVTLSPSEQATVLVGGSKCPQKHVRTEEFLRELPPIFSHIAAWNYVRRHPNEDTEIHIDGFHSKSTIAWEELRSRCDPKVYFRGDECNPFISLADIIAFMTDVRLYQAKVGPPDDLMKYRRLCVQNVESIWSGLSFDVECRYLDRYMLPKIAWTSNEHIDTVPVTARPMVFLLVDDIEKLAPNTVSLPPEQTIFPTNGREEPKRFRKILQDMDPYQATVTYAYLKGGCVQFFDRYIDGGKVRDGDSLVYMGENSRKIAMTYDDGYNIEVLRVRDLRNKVKEMWQDK